MWNFFWRIFFAEIFGSENPPLRNILLFFSQQKFWKTLFWSRGGTFSFDWLMIFFRETFLRSWNEFNFFYLFGEIFFSLKKVTKYIMRMCPTHFARNFLAFHWKNNKWKSTFNNLFISYINLSISLINEHPLKERMCNFKIGKTTYSKSSPITTYRKSKNKSSIHRQKH